MKTIQKLMAGTAMAVFAIGIMTGCGERCSTCSYVVTNPLTGADETTTLPELCGSKSEVDAYKTSTEATAALVNGTVTCVDN